MISKPNSLRDRLNKLSQAKAASGTTLVTRPAGEIVPLSYGQRGMWYVEQILPGTAVYSMPIGYRLKGPFHADAFERAVGKLVARHEALRTVFRRSGEERNAEQHVLGASHFHYELVDLSGEADPEGALKKAGEAAVLTPFNMENGPLFRAHVFRMGKHDHVTLLNAHHTVTDGWTHGIVLRELSALYRAEVSGEASTLAPVALQFSDFAKWQYGQLESERMTQQTQYWRKQLKDSPMLLELPTDRPRPSVQSLSGDVVHFELPASVTSKIEAVAREAGVSAYTLLLSAFEAMMYRYSGQTDILVGTPISGRHHAGTQDIVGYFVNTLVMRSRLEGNPSFSRLLKQNHDVTTSAYANQDVPFERLVEELRPNRAMSHNPMFQVMFTLQSETIHDWDMPGLTSELALFHMRTSKFDLWLSMEKGNDRYSGYFEYATDLFNRPTIERMSEAFKALLVSALEAPATALDDLALLTPALRAELQSFNATDTDYGTLDTLMQAFERQVEATPDRIALKFDDQTLTYAELNARANQLAHLLIANGVGRNQLVGIACPRSFELMVAIYATEKAGAAYVPLDPTQPADRLKFMIDDAKPSVVLTVRSAAAKVQGEGVHFVVVDELDLGAFSTKNPAPGADLDDLAYMIYTSGTTGRPKGAMVHHRGIANRLVWKQNYFGLEASDRVLQKTPIGFDVSVWELFWPLRIGACLVIAKPEGHTDPDYLTDIIRREAITTIHFVPPMLSMLLREETGERLQSLVRVICSGEELPTGTATRFFEACDAELVNLYGPTECAVDVTAWRVPRDVSALARLPIGAAIANTQIHILDKHLRPTPVGVPGELHIGGVQVGYGYLNRPELTATKFIPDPFSQTPGARLYKTGDLARVMPDGNVDFLGRLDFQVKVNGVRIETGEIENVLSEHPAVSGTTVLARDSGGNSRQLVAYVIPEEVAETADSSAETVSRWTEVFDINYGGEGGDPTSTFNTISWNSSYDGAAIPTSQMTEWLDGAVERILAGSPKRVLEIGCGTGMILFRVAPQTDLYVGCDISAVALEGLNKVLRQPAQAALPVKLHQAAAHEMDRLGDEKFDTIVINSVAQYFPSAAYLRNVVAAAMTRLSPGGRLFLGDLRNLMTHEDFHADIQAAKTTEALAADVFREKVRRRVYDDKELVIDPRFFVSMKDLLPEIGRVEIRAKDRAAVNEMSTFRYDAILHKASTDAKAEWHRETAPFVESLKTASGPVGLLGVTNPRFSASRLARRQESVAGRDASSVADGLADWRELAQEAGRDLHVSWSLAGEPGDWDLQFVPRGQTPAAFPIESGPGDADWEQWTNAPWLAARAREIEPDLRWHVKQLLPDHMQPALYHFLARFPLSTNGKVARDKMPAPFTGASALAEGAKDEREPNAMEKELLVIWRQILGVPTVGLVDNFFGCGGDSIRAIQVVWRARKAGIAVTTKQIFQYQTVEELARVAAFQAEAAAPAAASQAAAVTLPEGVEASYALNSFQRFQWDRLKAAPREGLSVVRLQLPLTGRIDAAAYGKAWEIVISRFPLMRSAFVDRGQGPRQEVYATAPSPFSYHDLRGQAVEAQTVEIKKIERGIWQRGFELASAPQFRVALIQVGAEDFRMIYAWNYMLHDGWSLAFVLKDLVAAYESLTESRALEPLVAGDYTQYQAWLARFDAKSTQGFWKENLAGLPGKVELAKAFPVGLADEFAYSKETLVYGKELTSRLYAFNRVERITLSSLFHSAWATVLHRHTKADQVVFGTMLSGRSEEVDGMGQMLGQMCNVLPFHVKVEDTMSARELCASAQMASLDLIRCEADTLDNALGSAGMTEVPYDSYVAIIPTPQYDESREAGGHLSPLLPKVEDLSAVLAQVDVPLRLDVCPFSETVQISISHRHRVYSRETAQQLLGELKQTVIDFMDNPDRKLGEVKA